MATASGYSSYVNPLAAAKVTPERIDMGVDYAGTGSLVAVGKAIITDISPGGWGSYGNYMQYKILSGPLSGKTVYYAEGVNPVPGLKVGDTVQAGSTIANLIPGWHSGIEIGFGGSTANSTYASQFGGGYSEGQRTAAGQAFSNLVSQLGGAPGLPEGRPISGTYSGNIPPGAGPAAGGASSSLGTPQGGLSLPGFGWVSDIANFISHPIPTLLTIALVIAGAFLLYKGVTHTLGSDQPQRRSA